MNNRMINNMIKDRMTISLPNERIAFIKRYKEEHQLKSNSQVVETALKLLENQALYDMFGEMGKKIGPNPEPLLGQEAAEDFLDDSW